MSASFTPRGYAPTLWFAYFRPRKSYISLKLKPWASCLVTPLEVQTSVYSGTIHAERQPVDLDLIILIAALVAATLAGWITAVQMRRRAGKALGRRIKDSELSSFNTWIDVEEAEKRKPLG